MQADITVIGGGPGGYVAAIRAAQKGAKTVLIEKGSLGGTCLNVGCIPTKALLQSAEMLHKIKNCKDYGLDIDEVRFDLKKVMERKKRIVNRLVSGVQYLVDKNKITLLKGRATLSDAKTVKVTLTDGKLKTINSSKIIIATGSEPFEIPGFSFSEDGIMDSTEALSLSKLPESLLIIGGGVIGVEFAGIYNTFGSQVTIVEMMDSLLPGEDVEASALLMAEYQKRGIKIFTNSKAKSWEKDGEKFKVKIETKDGEKIITAEKILVAVGRKPAIENLGLNKAKVEFNKKGIIVNSRMETNVDGIYAIGDVNGKYQLAHVASEEGIIAVDNALGDDKEMKYNAIPRCIYTTPEIAAVGLTEKEARVKYGDWIKVGHFPLNYNGKALIEGVEEGFMKIIVEPSYEQVIGTVIVGPHAPEMISQGTLSIALESTVETIDDIIFPHPTISEAFKEGVLDAKKLAIHR